MLWVREIPPCGQSDLALLRAGRAVLGWRYGLTFYGGAQFSDRYTGTAFGIRQNLGRFGAYSLDLTHARSQLADNQHYTGDSVRLRYSKLLNDIGTRVNFFSLRYSTAGFYTLSDTTYKGMAGGAPEQTVEDDGTVTTHYDTVYNLHMSRKAKNQLLLSQPMGEYGALSLSRDQQTYWNTSKTTQSLQFAWNATFRNLSLGISAQRSSGLYDNKKDNILALSLSVPLGNPALSTRLRFTATHADPLAPLPVPVSVVICRGRRIFSIASTSATARSSTTAAMPRCNTRARGETITRATATPVTPATSATG